MTKRGSAMSVQVHENPHKKAVICMYIASTPLFILAVDCVTFSWERMAHTFLILQKRSKRFFFSHTLASVFIIPNASISH